MGDGIERELDYRLSAFFAWCPRLAGKRVGLYGSGINAQRILENAHRGFEVSIIIDDSKAGTEVYGNRISSLGDAMAQDLDAIVVAATTRSSVLVAKRLWESCTSHGVDLFNMYGNDLIALGNFIDGSLDESLSRQLEAIESSDALYINAELLLNKEDSCSIASCLQRGARLSACIQAVIAYALGRQKPVAIYSVDPWQDQAELDHALEFFHLQECQVFAARERGLSVENGLYRLMYGTIPSNKGLHIGRDILRDCVMPATYGKSFLLAGPPLDSSSLQLQIAVQCATEHGGRGSGTWPCDTDTPESRLTQCIEACAPHIAALHDDSAVEIVSAVSSLVIGFVLWLARELCQRPDAAEEVLFASRDGYIVRKVYDQLREHDRSTTLPPSRYFYTSRRASKDAARDYGNQLGRYRNTLEYFNEIGLRPGGSYAFVEFVSGGTCQRHLEQIVPFRLDCFYFASRFGARTRSMSTASFYFDENDIEILRRYLFLEPFLSSTEPSLLSFSHDGQPVFAEERRPARDIALLQDIHEGVLFCTEEYFSKWHRTGDSVSHRFVDGLLGQFDANNADLMTLYDDVTNQVMDKRVSSIASTPLPDVGNPTRPEALLDLLGLFDDICSRNGLLYIATHGTLLGALRHNGPIPWDDDLDVAMPRDDYERLLTLAAEGAFPAPLFLETPDNDPTAFHSGHARLWAASTASPDVPDAEPSSRSGIWMDILPLDNCPLEDKAVERRQKIVRTWQRALLAKTYGVSRLWDCDPYKLSFYYALGMRLSRAFLCRRLKKACASVKHTGMLTIYACTYVRRTNDIRLRESDVANARRVPFAHTTIPVPAHPEDVLARYYGNDWMNVPPDAPASGKATGETGGAPGTAR